MSARIEYIVAAWTGPRNRHCARYNADPTYYIREHVASLARLKHGLSSICVVLAEGGPGDGYVAEIPPVLGGTPVRILRRPNAGLSYASFAAAIRSAAPAVTDFILMEDDYIFTQDGFDRYLAESLAARPRTGMYSGGVWPHSETMIRARDVAAVFIGISPRRAVDAALAQGYEGLPLYLDDPEAGYRAGYYGQTRWCWGLLDAGYEITDWLLDYSTAFWDSYADTTRVFEREPSFPEKDPRVVPATFLPQSLVVPLQVVERQTRISNGAVYSEGIVGYDGRIIPVIPCTSATVTS